MRNRLRNGKEITLADVAEHAGVSESTASRALNGVGELSDRTRAAVLQAADELNFQPSQLARSLRIKRTMTIGVVVPDVSSPFYATVLQGAQGALEQAGYRVMLMDSSQADDGEVAALKTLTSHRVDGLLLATVGVDQALFDQVVGCRGIPCVFFDSALPDAGSGTVILDNFVGIELLVDHLADHGHSRIGLLSGSLRETSGQERRTAFEAAVARRGLAFDESLVAGARWSRDEGHEAALRLLGATPRPTALIASSVELALGALLAARQLSLDIPADLALVTFDDAYFTELLDPPLTAVAYDSAEVGRRAASLLVAAIEDDQNERVDVRVPVELVQRRSCGCTA